MNNSTPIFLEKALHDQPLRQQSRFGVGRALMSPTRSQSGSDIYKSMRALRKDDIVLHILDNAELVGYSKVANEAQVIKLGFEDWYFVELREHVLLDPRYPEQ